MPQDVANVGAPVVGCSVGLAVVGAWVGNSVGTRVGTAVVGLGNEGTLVGAVEDGADEVGA